MRCAEATAPGILPVTSPEPWGIHADLDRTVRALHPLGLLDLQQVLVPTAPSATCPHLFQVIRAFCT